MPHKLVMKPDAVIEARLGINDKGKISKFFRDTCAKEMDRYVPMDKGNLRDYNLEGNNIIYEQPYAKYQYYGIRADMTHPIMTANRNRSHHPDATSYWDRWMWRAHKDDVIKQVQKKLKGKI